MRVISATNQDLETRIREGYFRTDLYYRLNVVTITIPALRQRKEDIPPLIEHFLQRFCLENHKQVRGVSQEARDMLLKYDYPGNIRELQNIIERAVVICRGDVITKEDLPFHDHFEAAGAAGGQAPKGLKESVEELERRMIQEAMTQCGNHQTKAAEMLGISERMLRYKLKKYGLK